MGSVTTVPASSLPGSCSFPGGFRRAIGGFYLIHAPRAFYVIYRLFRQCKPTGPYLKYRVEFDLKAFQFYCPGTDLPWDRLGQPIGEHEGRNSDWALGLHVATVAQDGHVLFTPFFGPVLPVVLKGSPWE